MKGKVYIYRYMDATRCASLLFKRANCSFCHDRGAACRLSFSSATAPPDFDLATHTRIPAHLLSLMAEASNPAYREFVDGRHGGVFESGVNWLNWPLFVQVDCLESTALLVDEPGLPNAASLHLVPQDVPYVILKQTLLPAAALSGLSLRFSTAGGATQGKQSDYTHFSCMFPRSPFLRQV